VIRSASLLAACAIVAGCAVDLSSNTHNRCSATQPCANGLICYQGFCVTGDGSSPMDAGVTSDTNVDGAPHDANANVPDTGCDAGATTCATHLPGACATGTAACGGMCIPPAPRTETCGGGDRDCDGLVDEESDVQCFPTGASGCTAQTDGTYQCAGACHPGVQHCTGGSLSTCTGAVTANGPEQCTTGTAIAVDEDCDGTIDEGCSCTNGATHMCFPGNPSQAGVGICHTGTQTCASMMWGSCTGAMMPGTETCMNNSADDDCDGHLDDIPGLGASCMPTTPGMGICANATMQCQGGSLACVAPTPMTEVCNHLDDDCDGSVDETFMFASDPANCGSCGNACGTGTTCCNGACVDESTDAMHCGACLTTCGASAANCCGSMCIDTTSDRMNCGACGNVCSGTQQCCSGQCVDEHSDAAHCGSCGNACTGANSACCQGTCNVPTAAACTGCGTDCSTLTPMQTCCPSGAGHSCADMQTDPANCGACGHACMGATSVCCGGSCIDPTQPAHCGSSCTACAAGQLCCSGGCVPVDTRNCQSCGVTCASGSACCGAGCRDLTSSNTDCGTCGMACTGGTHCSNSHCCGAGLTYCGSACTNTNTDNSNCGSCGHACGILSACSNGACGL
jgi:hypothetical protein